MSILTNHKRYEFVLANCQSYKNGEDIARLKEIVDAEIAAGSKDENNDTVQLNQAMRQIILGMGKLSEKFAQMSISSETPVQ